MGRHLDRFLKMMGAASGVAPALVTVLAMVASMGGGSFKRRLDLGGLDSAGRQRKLGRLGLGQNPHREGVIYREKMI
jgi:hypothetical protein